MSAISVFERHVFHGLWDKQKGKKSFGSPLLLASVSSFSMLKPVSRPAGMTEGRTCLCRVQVIKGFFFILSCHLFHLEGGPWDQFSCLLGRSTPCNALLLPLFCQSFGGCELGSSMEIAPCARGRERGPQERERQAELFGFWRWDRETTVTRGVGLSQQPLYRP